MASRDGRRAVVTGVGVVTVGGGDPEALWAHLLDPEAGPGDGFLHGFDPSVAIPRRRSRRMDPATQYAVVATAAALAQAGDLDLAPHRGAVLMASTYGGITSYDDAVRAQVAEGPAGVNPLVSTAAAASTGASAVAVEAGFTGPTLSVGAACASGSTVLVEALDKIRAGRADVVVAGGTEAPLTPTILTAFSGLKVFTASRPRPFDAERDGFAFAEGAGVLVVEERERALARGATVLAEVAGGSAATDVSGVYAPSDGAAVVEQCIRAALDDAGVDPADIAHVNAHGTGTRANDASEGAALERVFGPDVVVTANKGAVGHAGAAAGAIEAVATLLAMEHRLIPPTAGHRTLDPELHLDVVAGAPRPWEPGPVLSNALGLGGYVGSLVLLPPP
ncbi:beta-ketoacyl synthase N-terminal-like domain-containing protein [Iamia majanohamensis]|uniref:Beta-ketoacyl synthase N-terminal-like domain-containing protein n=1 Tax=Iamia majanohamensis TaxID=467976 RepID=A0AAE9Y644_9ACTN|nr:beta-ketoacyl synthase N-terminal-like domain-containing protein [Iamia majanohamensis]WCO67339.1 beta-ketoacyl synthase N-terminal-like domain-containing protein [Iamia majanohamensis]